MFGKINTRSTNHYQTSYATILYMSDTNVTIYCFEIYAKYHFKLVGLISISISSFALGLNCVKLESQ